MAFEISCGRGEEFQGLKRRGVYATFQRGSDCLSASPERPGRDKRIEVSPVDSAGV